jgi:hypothetical protein
MGTLTFLLPKTLLHSSLSTFSSQCCPAKSGMAWTWLDDGDAKKQKVGRARIERATNGLKVRCSTGLS